MKLPIRLIEFFDVSGIRYSEELSLKRFIPPEMLRKGLGFESDQSGPQPIRPGEVFNANYDFLIRLVILIRIFIGCPSM